MLRITRQTDYGVILLTHLAAEPGRVLNAPELGTEAGVPVPMAGKVLKTLTRAGILVSHRGVRGGYSLARPAIEITVAQVISALEGPIALTDCIAHGPGECCQEVGCPTRVNWHLINSAVGQALAGITLADMGRPAPSHHPRVVPDHQLLPLLSLSGRTQEG